MDELRRPDMRAHVRTPATSSKPRRHRVPFGRWIAGACVAVLVHAAGFAMMIVHSHAEADAFGAEGAVIGVELASPQLELERAPPGPLQEASVASTASEEQKEVVKDSDLPKDAPTETHEADRVVTQKETDKEKSEAPEKEAVAAPKADASIAAEAMAPPAVEDAKPSDKSVTRDPGVGAEAQRLAATWQREMSAHLHRNLRYPEGQPAKAAEVTLELVIDIAGRLLSANVISSSGDRAFDDAAVAMAWRASPVPTPPSSVAAGGLAFSVPVQFNMPKRRK